MRPRISDVVNADATLVGRKAWSDSGIYELEKRGIFGRSWLFLGHESIKTTQMYLDAHLALKEAALEKATPLEGHAGRFQADDRLLQFLNSL